MRFGLGAYRRPHRRRHGPDCRHSHAAVRGRNRRVAAYPGEDRRCARARHIMKESVQSGRSIPHGHLQERTAEQSVDVLDDGSARNIKRHVRNTIGMLLKCERRA